MFIGPCMIVIVEEWKTNLMSLAILFNFLCAQHVSDINISIFRSLRLPEIPSLSCLLPSVTLHNAYSVFLYPVKLIWDRSALLCHVTHRRAVIRYQYFGSAFDPWRLYRQVVPKRRYGITALRCGITPKKHRSRRKPEIPHMGDFGTVQGVKNFLNKCFLLSKYFKLLSLIKVNSMNYRDIF